jgi:hypothetical protein
MIIVTAPTVIMAQTPNWKNEWPYTDFSKSSVDFSEIISGGPPKDGIPAIDNPKFRPVSQITDLGQQEPVIVLKLNNKVKAYPLRILIWHEIANDEIGGVPVTVTYCPLCNAAIIFDRRINGNVLDFGVSGKLRHSDMIMYDRQTESWWQQFAGQGIVGEMVNVKLKRLPASIIPFSTFKKSYPKGLILVASRKSARRYGENPYVKYDSSQNPFLYRGNYKGPGRPLSYIVAIKNEAWLLEDLRQRKLIQHGNLRLIWHKGMNSALDSKKITQGRDIGFVTAQREENGVYKDVPYDTTFAFAFKAFYSDGIIHTIVKK